MKVTLREYKKSDLQRLVELANNKNVSRYMESIPYPYTQSDGEDYSEAVMGFEYTRVGIFETAVDLGMIAEYLYDDRGEDAPQPFNNDLMLGLRWVFNDMQSSEILMGTIVDLDGAATSTSIEASRRLGQSWKLSAEYRAQQDVDVADPLYPFRNDDYLQVDLAYYF